MSQPTETELKRRLRVIAAWTDLDQRELAAAVGVEYGTLRNWFSSTRGGPPLDSVIALAQHVGVPREFALDGWDAVGRQIEQPTDLEERLRAIEARIGL